MSFHFHQALAASTLINMATVLYSASKRTPAVAAAVLAAAIALRVAIGLLQVKKLDEQEKLIMGVA